MSFFSCGWSWPKVNFTTTITTTTKIFTIIIGFVPLYLLYLFILKNINNNKSVTDGIDSPSSVSLHLENGDARGSGDSGGDGGGSGDGGGGGGGDGRDSLPLVQSFWCGKELQQKGKSILQNRREELLNSTLHVYTTSLYSDTYQTITYVDTNTLITEEELINKDLLLNWQDLNVKLESAIASISKISGKADHTFSEHDGFCFSRRLIKQTATLAHKTIINMDVNQFRDTYKFCFNEQTDLLFLSEVFQIYRDGNVIDSMICSTMIIPFLEAFLGDWIRCVTDNKTRIPRRMTELLDLPEISGILPPVVLLIIKVAIGPPPGMNIRNLLWHGFLSESEFPTHITALLILLVADLCNQNKQSVGRSTHVPKKDMIQWLNKQPFPIHCPAIEGFNEDDVKVIKDLLSNNFFVLPTQRNLWLQSLQYIKQNNTYQTTLLIIPLLEHSIRRVFAAVNGCDERVITAKVHSLMTTLDVLVEDYIDESQTVPNKIFSEFGNNVMHILYDLFVAKNGPRIRDLMAHGVIYTDKIPHYFKNCLISLSLYLCMKYHVDNDDGPTGYVKNLKNQKLVTIYNFVEEYKPLFHPKSFHTRSINKIYQNWLKVEQIITSNHLTVSLLSIMIELRDKIVSHFREREGKELFFSKNENTIYDPRFGVSIDKEESKLFVPLTKLVELNESILTQILSSYEALKQRNEDKTASKSHRQIYSFFLDNLSNYSWFVQMMMLIVQTIEFDIENHLNFENNLLFLVQAQKVGGLLKTRIIKNEFSAAKELIYCTVGCAGPHEALLSGRDKKISSQLLTDYVQK